MPFVCLIYHSIFTFYPHLTTARSGIKSRANAGSIQSARAVCRFLYLGYLVSPLYRQRNYLDRRIWEHLLGTGAEIVRWLAGCAELMAGRDLSNASIPHAIPRWFCRMITASAT